MARPDLIVAPATPLGKGAVGIVRLSGPGVSRVAEQILGSTPAPRVATLCAFRDGSGGLIDRGLALYFPLGRSYTGEEMLELQGHGGPVVQQLLIRRCLEMGARLALPGEFTQRAFLNDRLDLSQAEAVADLIDAKSVLAARAAMRSLEGEFSHRVRACVDKLVELRALVESSMDFPEEGLELVPDIDLARRYEGLMLELDALRAGARLGRRLRDGATLVLVGTPNVGKSSLLNRLAQADVAIVSDIPGTTRDVLREHVVIDGLAFELMDTAGLRESDDPLERLGMERTLKTLQRADLVLHVTEGEEVPTSLPGLADQLVIRVVNKIDLTEESPRLIETEGRVTVYLSAKSGEGMDILRKAMVAAVGWTAAEEGTLIARERHQIALDQAKDVLDRAGQQLSARELFAEELRVAQGLLSSIAGAFTSEDLLGEIFSRFCIGK